MVEREPGPYWVRDRFEDEWVVALWSSGGAGDEWMLHGDTNGYRDADFIEIGPRAELPPPVIVETTSAHSAPNVAHYDMNTPEGRRALAAFLQLSQWPEPQPITDEQKTGEPFLLWSVPEAQWVQAYWDGHLWRDNDGAGLGDFGFEPVTHYVPLPPDLKP